MERCSNCGAPAKSGAKFCTSCGARLVQRPEAGTGIWSGSDLTSDRASAAWAWSEDAARLSSDADTENAAESDVADGGTEQPGSAIDEGETFVADAGEGDAVGEAAGEDQIGRKEETPAWPGAEPASGWATDWVAPDAPSEQGAEPWIGVESPAEGSKPVEDAPTDAMPYGFAGTERDDTLQVEEDQAVPAAALEPLSGTDTSHPGEAGGDPAERANALIDELRAVVSVLSSQQAAASTTDTTALASELEAARSQSDAELAGDFEGLRSALTAARERPRDVDTMLDLMGRLDTIITMQDAHDRYAQALDRAIQTLRGESEDEGARQEESPEYDGVLPWQAGAG